MKRTTLFTSLALAVFVLGTVTIGAATIHADGGSAQASPSSILINQGTLITANFPDAGSLSPTSCTVTPTPGTGHWYSAESNAGDSWQPTPGDWWYSAPAIGSNGSSQEFDGPTEPGSGNGWTSSGSIGGNSIETVVYPRTTTTYTVTCTYNDPPARSRVSGNGGTYSASVTVTVNPSDLGAACSVSPTTAVTGQQVTWTASANGGVGADNYSWSGDDNLSGNGIQNVISYLTTGTKAASVAVTDSASTKGIWEKSGSIPGAWTSGATGATECNFGNGPIPLCDNPGPDNKQGVVDGAASNTCWFSPNGGVEVDQYTCVTPPAGYIQNDTVTAQCSDNVTVGAAPVADLSASAVSPQTAIVGQAVNFSSTATNNGNGTSGSFPILFQVQNGDSFNSGFLGGLAPGASAPGSASYAFSAPGTYQVQACANRDSNNQEVTQDSNPSNDCSGWSSVTVYGAPNASLTVSPQSINSGDSSTLTWSCSSSATSCAGSNFDTAGAMSGSISVSPAQTTTYTVWANGPGGTKSSSQTLTVGPKLYPDLTATPGDAASGFAGSGIGLSGEVYNIGDASTGSSFHNLIQVCAANGDCNSYYQGIGTGLMSALGVNASKGVSATVNLATPGTYSYRVCADFSTDWSSSITESNENNNCSAWQAISVAAAPAADLTAGVVSPANATVGTPVTFSADAQNIGNADSGAFPILFQIANGDVFDSGYISVAASSDTVGTASYTFATSGTYQIRACVNRDTNWTAITTESNYDNDCGDWTTVTVGQATLPDLTVGTAPDLTITLGDSVPLSGTVSNIGNADAGGFDTIFVTNLSADRTAWNTIASGSHIDSLAQGANTDTSVTFPSSTFTTPGSYAYAYCADLNKSWAGSVAESNEDNNCSNWGTITVQAPLPAVPVTTDTTDPNQNSNSNQNQNSNPNSCPGPLALSLTASPTRVSSGSTAKLTWTAENMNQTCTLTGSDGSSIPLTSDICKEDGTNVTTGPITSQTVFTLNCGSAGSKQAIVNLVPKFNEF